MALVLSEPGSRPAWREAGLGYFKYSYFLRQRFGKTMARVSVDGGFTCPNVDGTVALGGCVYCDNESFSPARRLPRQAIRSQVEHGIAQVRTHRHPDGFLVYFQPATNTYAPVDKLRRLYDEALSVPGIEGLIIGTRPDCVPEPVLQLLEDYARTHYVSVEYGLQSIHERSLVWMNRGHDASSYFDAVARTQGRGMEIVAHVILGLPGESTDDMLATADAVAASGVDGIKIHSLHVVRGTPMAEQYQRGEIPVLERGPYLDLLIRFLERLPASMVIQRVTGDAPPEYLVAPTWPLRKQEFLQLLDRELIQRETWQGRLHPGHSARERT